MWNEEEDNNPYGSFDRRDSNSSDLPNAASIREHMSLAGLYPGSNLLIDSDSADFSSLRL